MVKPPVSIKPKLSLKSILRRDGNWSAFRKAYKHLMRPAIDTAVAKLLNCGRSIMGYGEYSCENPDCTHQKRIAFTCKNRLCSSCGKKATALWIQLQTRHFPDVPYQHITFTMPREFWDLFWLNRELLNEIAPLAAECIKLLALDKGVTLGIFLAIHTFGRDLKRNAHIHLCTTLAGLAQNNTTWVELQKFVAKDIMPLWRTRITQLLRKRYRAGLLQLPKSLSHLADDYRAFNQFLNQNYKKHWHVHCAKPENNHKRITEYLSRYIKRPVIANSRLKHYSGADVQFHYYDHKLKEKRIFKCSVFEFIQRVIQHIPDKNFRLIRYYGFLANAVRGKLLPIVNQLLGQQPKEAEDPITFAALAQQTFNFNPLKCILCGSQMLLSLVTFAANQIKLMNLYERELATAAS